MNFARVRGCFTSEADLSNGWPAGDTDSAQSEHSGVVMSLERQSVERKASVLTGKVVEAGGDP